MNVFIQQGQIKLVKSDSFDFWKKLFFSINAVFNIDNKLFLSTKSAY